MVHRAEHFFVLNFLIQLGLLQYFLNILQRMFCKNDNKFIAAEPEKYIAAARIFLQSGI